ncbi:hypothetical protein [Alishewanella sp. SMS8]|uniref:hypothetical protein n=1 Tax=Alishewanella sp. SMS8 TaxID=2994676 RepID=UPI002741A716|nr:hypothetical protein [Alishewanella sp. SMS8]MDP5460144.1 hypothetical protein [Alishewanella sp. SMS8]
MNKAIFQGIIEVCIVHAERLRWSMRYLAEKAPFTADSLAQLTDIELAIFDQFIVRFSKLQDAMGAKLLPAIIDLTHEEGELNTFIDKLNRLEKIGALDSVEQWLKLREMHNQFAHDYPDDPEIQAALLNKAFGIAE